MTPAHAEIVTLWRACRGRDGAVAGMAGAVQLPGTDRLPAAGGVLDQPAILLDAFARIEATWTWCDRHLK